LLLFACVCVGAVDLASVESAPLSPSAYAGAPMRSRTLDDRRSCWS
jgi:hypothetical protein